MEGNLENYYQTRFERFIATNFSMANAAIEVVEAYLDGKPAISGKKAISSSVRDDSFWNSAFLYSLTAPVYESESFVLSLARYFRQRNTACVKLILHIAQISPESVRRAVRYSGLVFHQYTERWWEVEQLAAVYPAEFGEFLRICHTFDRAYRERQEALEKCRGQLIELSPFELLVYSSLYAFEHLIPQTLRQGDINADHNAETKWYVINAILSWKLQTCTDKSFRLTDSIFGRSLKRHLSPFLFPSPDWPKAREDTYRAFGSLVAAQEELDSFRSRSMEAFCYDDTIRFEFAGTALVITELNLEAKQAWQRNGEKLNRLHNYWFYRAMHDFRVSGLATKQLGRPENEEGNRFAFTKALQTLLQLTEVYGLDETVLTETGLHVNLFQALLSLELMSVFFRNDFVIPYGKYLGETGNWRMALSLLAMKGLQQGSQNRFPLTWSDRKAKIIGIQAWTSSEIYPQGNAKAAEAILDFWTSDLRALSERMRESKLTSIPELSERPILKIGNYLFQLPWLVDLQNNATAAINNLRRIGARRDEAREETRRIERRLAQSFEAKGFNVSLNYQPPVTEADNPGEVDLICARDGQVLILEVKSTFLRKSKKDAWLHKTITLRKAGSQLRRKIKAVTSELTSNEELRRVLGLTESTGRFEVRGWIIDTSIEHDHEYFAGFLKVSLEEILIALRDDAHLLNDPQGFFESMLSQSDELLLSWLQKGGNTTTLYPNGFSGSSFVAAIENQAVWGRVP